MQTDETRRIIVDQTAAADETVYMRYKTLKEVNKAKLTSYLERLVELQQVEEELADDLEVRRKKHAEAMNEAIEALGDAVTCSFCGKKRDEVKHMVSAPSGACICDECVSLCRDIFAGRADGRNE
ncbi:MAG: ClpX C4-type zinc finger protein [Lachnospiraceae bacterium]|nr:ClpX C4-type zinc finger protein [Lachnospiraceae bacterium]